MAPIILTSEQDSIVNLHRKGHEAVDRGVTQSVSSPPPDLELDRLGGKTHLLAEVDTPEPGTGGRPGSAAMTNETNCYYFTDAQVNNMHPTLAHDMRSFDGGALTSNSFEFFDSPTTQRYPSIMPDIHPSYVAENYPTYQPHQPMSNPIPFEQAAPILNATWQSFVEQLGF
ncbi:hypothetical protein DXG03_009120 [Asterophora parasitica]|uniref:Uncharacterized protein n=1 Tax=Asterophora parasitica TaxID=117018 RepID=A0A9P7KDR0_9AGAR|nr:hypothetical protein DXG03_009120 [Asterophora parasitica]